MNLFRKPESTRYAHTSHRHDNVSDGSCLSVCLISKSEQKTANEFAVILSQPRAVLPLSSLISPLLQINPVKLLISVKLLYTVTSCQSGLSISL